MDALCLIMQGLTPIGGTMYIELILILIALSAGGLVFSQFANGKFILILFTGILLLISGLGIYGGIELQDGEVVDYGTGYTYATAQNYTVTQTRTTINNVYTDIVGTLFMAFALYAILISSSTMESGDGIHDTGRTSL